MGNDPPGRGSRTFPPPTPPKPSAGGFRPPIPKHGPSAPPRPHHHPDSRAPGRERAKGRPVAKEEGKAQGEGSTPKGKGALRTTHHKSKELPQQHKERQHRERERKGATTVRMVSSTRTGTKANTQKRGAPKIGGTETALTPGTESAQARPAARDPPHSQRGAPQGTPLHQAAGPKEGQLQGQTPAMPGWPVHPDPVPPKPHPRHRVTPTNHRSPHRLRGVHRGRGAPRTARDRSHNHRNPATRQ